MQIMRSVIWQGLFLLGKNDWVMTILWWFQGIWGLLSFWKVFWSSLWITVEAQKGKGAKRLSFHVAFSRSSLPFWDTWQLRPKSNPCKDTMAPTCCENIFLQYEQKWHLLFLLKRMKWTLSSVSISFSKVASFAPAFYALRRKFFSFHWLIAPSILDTSVHVTAASASYSCMYNFYSCSTILSTLNKTFPDHF